MSKRNGHLSRLREDICTAQHINQHSFSTLGFYLDIFSRSKSSSRSSSVSCFNSQPRHTSSVLTSPSWRHCPAKFGEILAPNYERINFCIINRSCLCFSYEKVKLKNHVESSPKTLTLCQSNREKKPCKNTVQWYSIQCVSAMFCTRDWVLLTEGELSVVSYG